jgi:hypothetical protein
VFKQKPLQCVNTMYFNRLHKLYPPGNIAARFMRGKKGSTISSILLLILYQ